MFFYFTSFVYQTGSFCINWYPRSSSQI